MLPLAPLLLVALLASQASPVDPEDVASLRQRLEQASGLTEEARQAASADLDAALASLQARDAALADQARFTDDARIARERLQQLEADASEPEITLPAPPPAGADLEALRTAQRQLRADLDVARDLALTLSAESDTVAMRKSELPEQLARARQAEDEARQRLELAVDGSQLDGQAARLQRAARVEEAAANIAALEAEDAYAEARQRLLPHLLQGARRRVSALVDALASVTERVDVTREREAAEIAADTERQRTQEVIQRLPVLQELARTNQELAARLTDVIERQRLLEGSAVAADEDSSGVSSSLRELEREQQELLSRYYGTREKVSKAGSAGALGVVLQRELSRLPSPVALRRRASELRRALAEDQLLQIETEEEEQRLRDLDQAVAEVLASLGPQAAEVRQDLSAVVRELLESRRDAVTPLSVDTQVLVELETSYLVTLEGSADLAEEFREFIAERILWVRAPGRERLVGVDEVERTSRWLFDPAAWRRAWSNGFREVSARPLLPTLLVLAVFAVLVRARELRRRLVALADRARSFRSDGFGLTLQAVLVTLVLASPPTLLLLLGAWMMTTPTGQPDVALAAGEALQRAALLVGSLSVLLVTVLPKGLGEAHLRWPGASARYLRLHILWFLPTGATLAAGVRLLEAGSSAGFANAIGRYVLALGLFVLAVFLALVLRPKGPLFTDVYKRTPDTLLERTSWLWYSLAIAVPTAIAVMALLGYGYGALELARLLGNSIVLLIVVVLGYGLLLRWLYVVRRRLLVEQARQRARARQQEEGEEAQPTPFDEDAVDVASVDQQTRRLFRTGSMAAAAVGLYLIWASALPALHVLERVELWPELRIADDTESLETPPVLARFQGEAEPAPDRAQPAGDQPAAEAAAPASESRGPELPEELTPTDPLTTVLTLGNLLGALVALLAMIVAARNLPGLLEISLLKRLPVDGGSRYAISALVRYGIVVVGSTVALGAIGIGWSNVQWLAAALTFGLGFGLQEIFANFVSGLIILLERPVRVGDVVTVAGVEGRVTQIHMRSTTITDWDNRELLVPNREFITSSLINWTLSDSITRVVVPVGIAYGSDTRKARGLLLRCAKECEFVLKDPNPSAIFREFGDSSLLFQLRVFIGNRDLWPDVVNDLHQRIDDAFRKAAIEISFPQRDLHVRSIGPLAEALAPRPREEDRSPE